MSVICTFDSHFKYLYDSLNSSDQNPSKINTEMSRFRRGLSWQWLNAFVHDHPNENLSAVIRVILSYTENEDPSVRVSAYSTLGAMLLTISPNDPLLFQEAFKTAITGLVVSPKLSIAVINMFVYLVRYVSPTRLEKFVSLVPVMPHFGVDVSAFIKDIPPIIPKMASLPVELHQNILRSIICVCGRQPSSAFATSVAQLVSLNPKQLLKDLCQLVIDNKLFQAILWIGPEILSNDINFDLLGPEGRQLFLDQAIPQFESEKPNILQFEHACQIAALLLRKLKGDEYEAVHSRIKAAIHDGYNIHCKARMFILPSPPSEFESLIQFSKDDPDAFQGSRLTGIASYLLDQVKLGKDGVPHFVEIANIFYSFRDSENDLYCTVIEQFARCMPHFLQYFNSSEEKFEGHIDLLKYILDKPAINWVQNEAIAHLIDAITPISYLLENHFHNYSDIAIGKLIEFCDSSNNRLADTAKHVLLNMSSYSNLDIILFKLSNSDWVTENITARRFSLLSELAKLFKQESVLFIHFLGIAYDCLSFFDSIEVRSPIFEFLSYLNLKFNQVPQHIIDIAFLFIGYHFMIYSQCPLEPIDPKYRMMIPQIPFLDNVDTDIVTNSKIDHQKSLAHVGNAFKFLISVSKSMKLEKSTFGFFQTLLTYSIQLIPIFDQLAIEAAYELASDKENIENLAKKIFISTSSDEVAAACCLIFMHSNKSLPKKVFELVQNFLIPGTTYDPTLLFRCFIICDSTDHDAAVNALSRLIPHLPIKEATVLQYKLIFVLRKAIVESIEEKYIFALLALHPTYDQKVYEYIQKTPYIDWPLQDDELNNSLTEFFEHSTFGNTIKESKIKPGKFEDLDNDHLLYMINHREYFELEGLDNYIRENPSKFSKINIKQNLNQKQEFNKIDIDLTKITKLCSNSPFVKKDKFVKSEILIRTFLQFSSKKKPISLEYYIKLVTFLISRYEENHNPNPLLISLTYGIETKLWVPLDIISNHMFLFQEPFLSYITYHVGGSNTNYDHLPSEIKKFVDDIVSINLHPASRNPPNPHWLRDIFPIAPQYFFNMILTSEGFKAHNLLQMVPKMRHSTFDPDCSASVLSWISNELQHFEELTSTRKQLSLLRFTTSIMDSLQFNNQVLYHSSVELILPSIQQLHAENGIFYRELSSMLIYFVSSIQDPLQLQDFFRGLQPSSSAYPLFISYTCYLVAFRKVSIPLPSQPIIENFLRIGTASQIAAILRGLCNLFKCGEGQLLIKSITNEIEKNIGSFSTNFRILEPLIVIVQRLLEKPQLLFTPYIFTRNSFVGLMQNTDYPAFHSAAYLMPYAIPVCNNLISSLVKLNFSFDSISKSINHFYRVYVRSPRTDEEAINFSESNQRKKVSTQIAPYLKKRFTKFPDLILCQFLLTVLEDCGENDDPPSTLIIQMPTSPLSQPGDCHSLFFLYMLKTIKMAVEKANGDRKEMMLELMETIPDTYMPKSREISAKMIFKPDCDGDKLFLIACSENENVQEIIEEISLIEQ